MTSYLWTTQHTLNKVSDTTTERQDTKSAEGELIPIVYGIGRVGGKIAALKETSTHVYVLAVFCLGEIDSYEDVLVDGVAFVDAATSGYELTTYTGTTSQTADTTMTEAWAAYADDLVLSINGTDVGVAYGVFKFPLDYRWTNIEAIVKGKKVYDSRTTLTVWSDNAALCLADFISSPIYGQNKTVDSTSLSALANHNDTIITGSIKQSTLNLVISNQALTSAWVEVLRGYAECFVVDNGTSVYLKINKAETPSAVYLDDSDMMNFQLFTRSVKAEPNIVAIRWTNTDVEPWRDEIVSAETAAVAAGTDYQRESVVDMPGYTNYTQADRVAQLRLAWLQNAVYWATFETFDEALAYQVGDTFYIKNNSVGLTSYVTVRITNSELIRLGRWKITVEYYTSDLYAYTAHAAPTYSDVTINLRGAARYESDALEVTDADENVVTMGQLVCMAKRAQRTADMAMMKALSPDQTFRNFHYQKWQKKTAAYTAEPGECLAVDTSGGAVTITLPSLWYTNEQASVSFLDYSGSFNTNNLTINGNFANIEGSGSNLVISTARDRFTLVYIDGTQGWVRVN